MVSRHRSDKRLESLLETFHLCTHVRALLGFCHLRQLLDYSITDAKAVGMLQCDYDVKRFKS